MKAVSSLRGDCWNYPQEMLSHVETLASRAVVLIAECIDCLRNEDGVGSSMRSTEDPAAKFMPLALLLKTGLVSQVQKLCARYLESNDDINCDLCSNHESLRNVNDRERFNVIHQVVLPLLGTLAHCYAELDAIPDARTAHKDSSVHTKPPPPPGMLSLKNYTDIAAFVELAVCAGVVPLLEPNILASVDDRLRFMLPKTLAGRMPRKALLWGDLRHSHIDNGTKIAQLVAVVGVVGRLILLDRFAPMLLPRHISDLHGAILQVEELRQQNANGLVLPKSVQVIINKLLPIPGMEVSAINDILLAKSYQRLLVHGTKGPKWLRQRVSGLLAALAASDLTAIVHVFVQCDSSDRSAAAFRLARALATGNHPDTYFHAIMDQLFTMLDAVYQNHESLTNLIQAESDHQDQANIHTVWAILDCLPSLTRESYLQRRIQENVGSPAALDSRIHRIILEWGTLLSNIPPSSNGMYLCRSILLPLTIEELPDDRGLPTSLLSLLVRLATMQSVLESRVKEDTIVCLRMFAKRFCCNHFPIPGKLPIRGSDLWSLGLVYSITPCTWDIAGWDFCVNPNMIKNGHDRVTMTRREVMPSDDNLAHATQEIEKRVRFVIESLNSDPSASVVAGLFHSLLQIYFIVFNQVGHDLDTIPFLFRSRAVKAVPLVCIPILCEECPISSLLSEDVSESTGILEMVNVVLRYTLKRFWEFNIAPHEEALSESRLHDSADFLGEVLRIPAYLALTTNQDDQNDASSDEALLSMSSLLLSILVSILELGAEKRSQEEEEKLCALKHVLLPFATQTGDRRHEQSIQATVGEMVAMASHALALLVSRSCSCDLHQSSKEISPSSARQLDTISQAELDLKSSEPPLRARGVVSLRHLAAACAEERRENLISSTDSREMLKKLLSLSVSALGDTESYVYLAAVHTIVSLSDADPSYVIPRIGQALACGVLWPSSESLTNEQRIKVAEAITFSTRRRPMLNDDLLSFLIELMIFGPAAKSHQESYSIFDAVSAQHQTHHYYLNGLSPRLETDADSSIDWDALETRIRTGGPLFASEEDDIVRASMLNVCAELLASSETPGISRLFPTLVSASYLGLSLEISRPVRRSAVCLAIELYSALLREADSIDGNTTGFISIPLAMALAASREDRLHIALERCCNGIDLADLGVAKQRVFDPTLEARCNEALRLRQQAEERGIISAGRLALSSKREIQSNPVARMLISSFEGSIMLPDVETSELA